MEDFDQNGSLLADGKEAEPLLTIEEHAASRAIPPSTLSAVMQFQNWAGGKKVLGRGFESAVNAFLGASMGGKRDVT